MSNDDEALLEAKITTLTTQQEARRANWQYEEAARNAKIVAIEKYLTRLRDARLAKEARKIESAIYMAGIQAQHDAAKAAMAVPTLLLPPVPKG